MYPSELEKLLGQDSEEEGGEEIKEEETEDELMAIYNREIEECFGIFDKNKTGMIDTRHGEKALEALGIHLSFLEMEEVIDAMDTEGVIFFDQFQPVALEKMFQFNEFDALKEAFQTFDPDREGFVSGERLRRSLLTLGDPLQDREARELIKMGDPGNRGVVDYELATRVLLSHK